ncbi:MAG: hypothetical protein LBH63_01660, partial [Clostridiales Family XIII bacterium]|nr:hypothetical protein [Clostridiales Family XIII bacterium]
MKNTHAINRSLRVVALLALSLCLTLGMFPSGIFANIEGAGGVKVYEGSSLIYNGSDDGDAATPSDIAATANGNSLTITVPPGNYAGLTVVGGGAGDSVVLQMNGDATFAGDAANAPALPPGTGAGVTGIYISGDIGDSPALTIQGSGTLTAVGAPGTGSGGIMSNGELTINSGVNATGADGVDGGSGIAADNLIVGTSGWPTVTARGGAA